MYIKSIRGHKGGSSEPPLTPFAYKPACNQYLFLISQATPFAEKGRVWSCCKQSMKSVNLISQSNFQLWRHLVSESSDYFTTHLVHLYLTMLFNCAVQYLCFQRQLISCSVIRPFPSLQWVWLARPCSYPYVSAQQGPLLSKVSAILLPSLYAEKCVRS